MPSVRVAPYRQIATEIAGRLAAGRAGRDPFAPWEEEVVVPSRGMAEAIAAELLRRMPHGIAGLRLHSLEELATRILTARGETPRVASAAERRLAMRIAVRAFDEPLMASRGIAAMLERSYRDVRDSATTVRLVPGLRNRRRTELVLRAWAEYERAIASLNAIDPAELLLRAAQRADGSLPPQLLAGFYDMTGVQRALMQALIRAGRLEHVWVPTDEPFAQEFISRVILSRGDGEGPSSVQRGRSFALYGAQDDTRTAGALHTYDTRLDEFRGVCAEIAELLAAGTPANQIGIVARSLEPYDVRLLNRFAAEHGFRTTLPEEIPLAAHRIGRGALTLLRLRERGFPRAEVLGLLRDGLRVATRIDADEADAATRRARIAGGTSDELRRMRNRPRIIDDYIALVAELENTTFDPTRFRIETESDLEAAEALDGITTLIKRVPGATQADLIDAIEQATLHRQTATDDRRPAVWAGELLRFRGRSFQHLFAVRMQDDVFPQRRTEDPLLPDSDRRLLGLREIGDGRDEERLLFSLVKQAAETVTFTHATSDGFGKVLRPSRFIRNERRTGFSPSRGGPKPALRLPLRPLQLLVQSGTGGVFDGYLGPLAPGQLRALSPTQLEDFGECPQKFLLEHILRVEDIDHPERELQIHHRDKGILDHRILEEFYKHAGGLRTPLSAGLLQQLDDLVDRHFDEHEAIAPPFNPTVRAIERRATKRVLREFVAADAADLEANGLEPKYFEYRFGAKHRGAADHPEPFVVHAGGVPVHVEGTIDRIDVGRAEARPTYRIVDYKSGKALRHVNLGDKIDRGVRLQLALYAMAVAEFFHVDAEQVSGTIKPLVPGETRPAKFAFALHEKRAALLETLELFIRAILSGTFPAFPNEDDDFNSCKYCPVNHSCRTRHDLDERYAVQQFRDPRTLLSRGVR